MFFLYLFLFSIFFTFSSNKLQIEWDGLKIDLSSCALITDIVNGISFDPKQIFKEFMLPSGKTKTKKYIEKLFNPNFICVSVNESLLVNLVIDRKALGFPEGKYLFPLLHACIIRGFCKALPIADLEKLKFFKDIRYLCFNYLKDNMQKSPELLTTYFGSITKNVHGYHCIQSSSEWNELINSQNGEYFLNALNKKYCDTFRLDSLSPPVLSALLKKYPRSVSKVFISNCEMNETLFELLHFNRITLKNCRNLNFGKTEQEINHIMRHEVFNKYCLVNNSFVMENCSLDQISLEQCKNFISKEIIRNLSNQIALLVLYSSLFFGGCCTFPKPSFLTAVLSTIMLFMSKFFVSNSDWVYVFCAMRIAHDVIPILLKEPFVVPYRCFSEFIMICYLGFSFCDEYHHCRRDMRNLKKNLFGILPKYHFLDILCKLFFLI